VWRKLTVSPDFDELQQEESMPTVGCYEERKGKFSLKKLIAYRSTWWQVYNCLDITCTKLKDHLNPLVFALAFEASDIHFLATFLKETFIAVYSSCATKPKDRKSIFFHFQWYWHCSILLVEDAAGLCKMQRWLKSKLGNNGNFFYQSRKVGHEIAKIFMFVFVMEVYNKLQPTCVTCGFR